MTTSRVAHRTNETVGPGCDAVGWLAFAASPAFALMAWLAAHHATAMALCTAGPAILPIDSMTAMYLLMSVFHLSPWLRLASRGR